MKKGVNLVSAYTHPQYTQPPRVTFIYSFGVFIFRKIPLKFYLLQKWFIILYSLSGIFAARARTNLITSTELTIFSNRSLSEESLYPNKAAQQLLRNAKAAIEFQRLPTSSNLLVLWVCRYSIGFSIQINVT